MTGPVRVLPDAAAMIAWGRRVGAELVVGDVVILTGELGAGKTTLTRGIGEAMGVRGAVSSPTFVLAREHPPVGEGPALVHVDAYRLTHAVDLDDLDLPVASSVTVVEWGEGRAEQLSDDRLHIELTVEAHGRLARISGYGDRWTAARLEALAADA